METVVAGQTGWLAPPGDAQAWAAAMSEAIDVGKVGRAAMGVAGAERAKQLYSLDAMCAATLQAYADVLESRNTKGGA